MKDAAMPIRIRMKPRPVAPPIIIATPPRKPMTKKRRASRSTTPEEAHRIGRELVDRLTDHKHEYIITTHVDRNHIHNHIIFNQTSFVDYKKFRSNKQTVRRMRALSDEICKEHGLNVI